MSLSLSIYAAKHARIVFVPSQAFAHPCPNHGNKLRIVLAFERLKAGEIEIHDWMADAIGGRVRAAADAGVSEPERLRDEALLHLLCEMRQRMADIQ